MLYKLNIILQKNGIVWGLLLIGLLLKLSLCTYGLPYLFHPDEPYIFKDPFKLLYNYRNMDFSSTTNLYFWVLILWYSVYFVFCLITGNISGLTQFQNLLIAEDPSIILFGRLLSILLSLIGSYFILKIIIKTTKDTILQFLFGLTLILNPIEIISNVWIKFDTATYCFLSILFYMSYKYLIENNTHLKNRIYILSFVALSIRIDLIAFLIAFAFIDFSLARKKETAKPFILQRLKPAFTGIILYLIITLLPLTLLIGSKESVSAKIPVTKPFESAIVSKSVQFSFSLILDNIIANLGFYLLTCTIVTFGPFIILPIITHLKNRFEKPFLKLLLLVIVILFMPLLVFGYHAPHYYLLSALALLVLSFLSISVIKNTKYRYFVAIFNLLYTASITFQIIYAINFQPDTRITAKQYMLKTTSKTDLIAIEKYLNAGFFPPINECPEVLLEKIEAIKKYNIGTGETFKSQVSKINSGECRKILEISAPKRFKNTEYENKWAIDYSPTLLLKKSPDYFISMIDYNRQMHPGSFSSALLANYSIISKFEPNFIDPRIKIVIANENYYPCFYIYKKLN